MNLRCAAAFLVLSGGGTEMHNGHSFSSPLVATALTTPSHSQAAVSISPGRRTARSSPSFPSPSSPSSLSMVISSLSLEEYVRSRTEAEELSSSPRRSATGIPLRPAPSSSSSSSSSGAAGADSATSSAGVLGASSSTAPKKRTVKKRSLPGRRKKAVRATSVGGGGGGRAAMYRPYESAIEALRAYHSVHGDLVIPRRFVVPSSPEYPEEWHGVDLSSSVYDMRWWQLHVKSNTARVAELNSLGFVWERLQPEWNLVLEALVAYSMKYGHVLVPSSFVVPRGDDVAWPRATWGIRLGNCVHRMRIRHDFLRGPSAASRKAQLDGLGFVWDVNERAFLRTYRALKHFRRMERRKSAVAAAAASSSSRGAAGGGGGDGAPPAAAGRFRALRVPSTFVVPEGEEWGWPEDLWGLPLGAKCSAIRHKGLYVKDQPDRQRALEELGFQWSGNATLGWLQVVHAAAVFSRLHGRTLDVPINFVVPAPPTRRVQRHGRREESFDGDGDSDDDNDEVDHRATWTDDAWPWPEQLWGFPLGQRLKDVRLKGAYLTGDAASSRRAQLDALGFNWTPKRGRRRRP